MVLIDKSKLVIGDFKKLEVWNFATELAIEIYKLTMTGKLAKDFSFRDQIRRAAISIPSNIAEGEESGFDKVGIRYFYIAKASLAEVNTQLLIACKIQYINTKQYEGLLERIEVVSKMLRKLINYRIEYNKNQ